MTDQNEKLLPGLEGRILLEAARYDFDEFLSDFEKDWGRAPDVAVRSETGLVLSFEGSKVLLRFVNAKDADAPLVAQNNREWESASEVADRHAAHVEAASFLEEKTNLLKAACDFVRVMTSLALVRGVVAVNTTNTLMTPEGYRNGAQVMTDGKSFPVHCVIFTGVWRASEEGGTNGYTAGFNRFGLPEIEILESRRGAYAVREFLQNLSGFILETGNILRPGQDLVAGPNERFAVTYSEGVAFPEEVKTLKIAFG